MDHSEAAVALFNKYAERYQNKYMDSAAYDVYQDRFCAGLGAGARVLEVGCGPGNVTRYLLRQRPDFRVLATDLAPEMLALAGRNVPGAEVQLLDVRAMGTLEESFDGVVNGFCLPYLTKAEALQWIRSAWDVLLPGGMLYLSTMEGDFADSGYQTTSSGEDQLYIYYHEGTYLEAELRAVGFEEVELFRQDFMEDGEVAFKDLMVLARKPLGGN